MEAPNLGLTTPGILSWPLAGSGASVRPAPTRPAESMIRPIRATENRMETERQANRVLWDGWAARHVDSDFYDVAAFKQGKSSLLQIARDLVGTVAGTQL